MPDFLTRLKAEYAEVTERMVRISGFLSDPSSASIGMYQAGLLAVQYEAMNTYAKILDLRIKNLESVKTDPQ